MDLEDLGVEAEIAKRPSRSKSSSRSSSEIVSEKRTDRNGIDRHGWNHWNSWNSWNCWND